MYINIILLAMFSAIITFSAGFLIGRKGAIVINIGFSKILAVSAL
jgi:hypothetical protein